MGAGLGNVKGSLRIGYRLDGFGFLIKEESLFPLIIYF